MYRKLSLLLSVFVLGFSIATGASADVMVKQGTAGADHHAEYRGQWVNNLHHLWFEFPTADASKLEVWGYTNRTSYAPGETINLHVNTTAKTYDIIITRDGGEQEVVLEKKAVPGKHYATPKDAYKTGPRWPVSQKLKIPADWKSGGYVITLRVVDKKASANKRLADGKGKVIEQQAFFILRPATPGKNKIALLAATTSWQAYNDWGGASFYGGVNGGHEPVLSTQRPWARGLIWMPKGAPRLNGGNQKVAIGDIPRYPWPEFAYSRGYSKFARAAGWASYESLFARWAEQQGYSLDYFAQDDLNARPELLKAYKAVVIVGHDEYSTREERQAIDDYIEQGGKLIRLGGNVIWQVRREGNTLVCYKYLAYGEDPVRNDPEKKHLLTTTWEAQAVNWPPAQTYGVNGFRGIYLKFGGFQPRASGGFTVYRPKHWALEGTDLYYGDVFGQESTIVGYEGDGLDYTFKYGLPYPTGDDGAPADKIEIIAMAPANLEEEDHGNPGTYLFVGDADLSFAARDIYGADTEENRAKLRYGSVMMINMKKGKGEVFSAATVEWVKGLEDRNPFVEKITQNALNRYMK